MTATGCDLAIVGGGIIGACTAYLAALRWPDRRILLLDRGLIGAGNATAYSAALAPHFGHSDRVLHMSQRALALYRDWQRDARLALYELDVLLLASPQRREALLPMLGGEARPVAAATLAARCPYLRAPADWSALAITAMACADPAALDRQLVAHALRGPAVRCWEGAQVIDLDPAGSRGCTLGLADGRTITAAHVVVATGPWLLPGAVAEAAGAAHIRRKKIVALHLDIRPPVDAPALVLADEEAFLMPHADGTRWLMSITSDEWDCAAEPGSLFIRPRERAHALDILARLAPALAAHCTGGRVFSDSYSEDREPRILGERNRWAAVAGASGAGFRLAPALAAAALDWLHGD